MRAWREELEDPMERQTLEPYQPVDVAGESFNEFVAISFVRRVTRIGRRSMRTSATPRRASPDRRRGTGIRP
jgi:hypothetical protein